MQADQDSRRGQIPPLTRLLIIVGLSTIVGLMVPAPLLAQAPPERPVESAPPQRAATATRRDTKNGFVFRDGEDVRSITQTANGSATNSGKESSRIRIRSDNGLARTQGPPPHRPPQEPGRGSAGPATPPLPPGVTMPSGPVVPPRHDATMAPVNPSRPNVADSPTVPPLPVPAPESAPAAKAPRRPSSGSKTSSRWPSSTTRPWPRPRPSSVSRGAGPGRPGSGPTRSSATRPSTSGPGRARRGPRSASTRPLSSSRRSLREQAADQPPEVRVGRPSRPTGSPLAQELRVLNSVRIHFFEALGAQQLVDRPPRAATRSPTPRCGRPRRWSTAARPTPRPAPAQIQQQQTPRRPGRRRERVPPRLGQPHRRGRVAWPAADPARRPARRRRTRPRLRRHALHPRNSPEIKAAEAEIRRDEVVVHRERVEPIPNLFVQGDVGLELRGRRYDGQPHWSTETSPSGTRTRGRSSRRSSHLHAGAGEPPAGVQLSLEKRLADEMAIYNSASALVRTYRDETLPRARRRTSCCWRATSSAGRPGPRCWWPSGSGSSSRSSTSTSLVELRHAEIEIKGPPAGGLRCRSPSRSRSLNVTEQPDDNCSTRQSQTRGPSRRRGRGLKFCFGPYAASASPRRWPQPGMLAPSGMSASARHDLRRRGHRAGPAGRSSSRRVPMYQLWRMPLDLGLALELLPAPPSTTSIAFISIMSCGQPGTFQRGSW